MARRFRIASHTHSTSGGVTTRTRHGQLNTPVLWVQAKFSAMGRKRSFGLGAPLMGVRPVSDAATMTPVERTYFWRRQLLNPFAFIDAPPAIAALEPQA